MFGLLKKLFAGGGAAAVHTAQPVHCGDYTITPVPRKEANGWRVEGLISRHIDGEHKEFRFVRADVYFSIDDTVSATVQKAERIIKEQGDRMFESP